MNPDTVQLLLDLNRRFYTDFGSSFAATRRRIQPGVRRALADLPDSGEEAWIDLGCGSGALAVEWLEADRQSAYVGVDSSETLLKEAERAIEDLPGRERITFIQADLADSGWINRVQGTFTGALSFAVLHHLPSLEMRKRVAEQVSHLLPAGGRFILSVWQFQYSPKLLARRVPPEQVGLNPRDLEPGDTILDWRAEDARQTGPVGLRYVHQFEPGELAEIAQSAGFQVAKTFESDGQGGKLGLYEVWVKK